MGDGKRASRGEGGGGSLPFACNLPAPAASMGKLNGGIFWPIHGRNGRRDVNGHIYSAPVRTLYDDFLTIYDCFIVVLQD